MGKHAYLIIAHNEPKVLEMLIRLLDHPQNDIYLHIDLRATILCQRIEQLHLTHSKLNLVRPQISVHWGHVSQVEVELKLFKAAFQQGGYVYYHLLSGVDLPIKTQDEIHHFFNQHQGEEFITFWNNEAHQRDLQRKVYRKYVFTRYYKDPRPLLHHSTSFLRNFYLALQKLTHYRRHFPYAPKKGYNWVSITNDFCQYLLLHEEELLQLYKQTLCADEIFMQTLLTNSPFKNHAHCPDNEAEGSMRAIDWERGNPYVWQEQDVDDLLASPYLFARKFSERHFEAVRKIGERLNPKISIHL